MPLMKQCTILLIVYISYSTMTATSPQQGFCFLQGGAQPDAKSKAKFSSFFNNVVIELDKDTYGPDNHLAEWHRSPSSTELDGFTVKTPVCGSVYIWSRADRV